MGIPYIRSKFADDENLMAALKVAALGRGNWDLLMVATIQFILALFVPTVTFSTPSTNSINQRFAERRRVFD
jgi:hypothetical protein